MGETKKEDKKMAIIYNIDDYRNKKRRQTPEERMKRFLEQQGGWESPKEQDEFYRQLARKDEADIKAMFAR